MRNPKYAKKKKKQTGKVLWILIAVCLVLLAGAVIVLVGLGDSDKDSQNPAVETTSPGQSTEAAGNTEENGQPDVTEDMTDPVQTDPGELSGETITLSQDGSCILIRTAYCTLRFPAEHREYLDFEEFTDAGKSTAVFRLKLDNADYELFRVHFGQEHLGDKLGVLKTGGGDIPVSYEVYAMGEEAFADDEGWLIYNGMMDGFSMIMNSITEDSRFMSVSAVEPVERQDVTLTHWTMDLPEDIQWEETNENGYYLVSFFGIVNGEKIELFRVAIGEPSLKSVLGVYKLDGASKPISVESCEVPDISGWPESEVSRLFAMMESINDVIEAIVSSEEFSAE